MNNEIISTGMNDLASVDHDIAIAFELIGPPPPRIRPQGFETFLATIISQQISTEAASAILGRVKTLLPQVTASALLDTDAKALRQAGLSYRKIEYIRGLAGAVESGDFDINGLDTLSDKDAIETITNLRGFGRWSAEIYLMFSLKRQDIFPADDLALQVSLARLKNLPQKPTTKQARKITHHWSPWRSVGSLFLWHYYRGIPA